MNMCPPPLIERRTPLVIAKVMTRLNIKDIVTADPIVCYSLSTPKLEVQDAVTMIEGQEPPLNNELTHEDADENALEPHHQVKTHNQSNNG